MSLFGDFPDDDASAPFTPSRKGPKASSSLFADDNDDTRTSTPKPSASLFDGPSAGAHGGDDEEGGWGMPTPKSSRKRKSPREVAKTLLRESDVPPAYKGMLEGAVGKFSDGEGGDIPTSAIKEILESADGVSAADKRRIGEILGVETGEGFGKGEFFVLLALIGIAAEGEEVGLDAVDERRRNLPIPNLPILNLPEPKPATPLRVSQRPTPQEEQPPSAKSRPVQRKESFGFPDTDPWGSPDMHRGHAHAQTNGNGAGNAAERTAPHRTTSDFSTASHKQQRSGGSSVAAARVGGERQPGGTFGSTGGWGELTDPTTSAFRDSGLTSDAGGFGGDAAVGLGGLADEGPGSAAALLGRAAVSSRNAFAAPEETVIVTSISEKEGMMFFQHRNYEVSSARRNSRVVRRYSDFVWLLDCLHKRFPFRALPLLPPKRVGINGNHLAADASFIEKRRRGLARFVNALVRHPVLGKEPLVVMFLTVPTELSVWRKQATISVQDEFQNKPLPPNLEDSLPADLQTLFDRVRVGVSRSAECYINLCTLAERLAKRNEGLAAEYGRLANCLDSATASSEDTYAADANDVPLLNAGLRGTGRHLMTAKALLEDEARATDTGFLEDLKLMRDGLVSLRDLFDRRDRLDKDEIPKLERRIEGNEAKLKYLRDRPEGTGKPGDVEKVEEAIFKDKNAIVTAHARHIFIKQALREEILFFQGTRFQVARAQQDWAAERVKYAELYAENWRGAVVEVEGMVVEGGGS